MTQAGRERSLVIKSNATRTYLQSNSSESRVTFCVSGDRSLSLSTGRDFSFDMGSDYEAHPAPLPTDIMNSFIGGEINHSFSSNVTTKNRGALTPLQIRAVILWYRDNFTFPFTKERSYFQDRGMDGTKIFTDDKKRKKWRRTRIR